jgi:hypothetical protein
VPTFCNACHLPYDTLVRDEAKFSVHQVLQRCPECRHIVIYRSSGMPELTEIEIAEHVVRARE